MPRTPCPGIFQNGFFGSIENTATEAARDLGPLFFLAHHRAIDDEPCGTELGSARRGYQALLA